MFFLVHKTWSIVEEEMIVMRDILISVIRIVIVFIVFKMIVGGVHKLFTFIADVIKQHVLDEQLRSEHEEFESKEASKE